MPLVFRVKARRRSWWHYAVAGVFSIFGSAFWGWVAYSVLGFPLTVAWQVFLVFAALSLLFLPLAYVANEKQFRDHRSRALPKLGVAFGASLGLATFYFLGKQELAKDNSSDTIVPLILCLVSLCIGVVISLFFIKFEVE